MANNDQHSQSPQRGGSGNFAENPARAAEAGKKGGEHGQGSHSQAAHSEGSHSQASQTRGTHDPLAKHSIGNFADDREKAAEAGKKGGSH